MSYRDGKEIEVWLEKNQIKNGWFRVYWKIDDSMKAWSLEKLADFGGLTFEESEGDGLRYEWYYRDGKQDGVTKGWYPNGQIKTMKKFDNGNRIGEWSAWFIGGNIKLKENYKDDKRHGIRTKWGNNGKKRWEMFYINGLKDGTWTFWDKNGNIIKEEIWLVGILCQSKDDKGKIKFDIKDQK